MSEGRVRNGDVELWFEDFGDPAHSTVLLVAGATDQAVFWEPYFYEPLLKAGYRVVRYDNRDNGLSTWIDYEKDPYTIPDMAGDAIAVLDALAVDRAHVIGLSMGGMISQQVSLDHPDRVRSLTSIMSSPSSPDDPALPDMEPKVHELIAGLEASDGTVTVEWMVDVSEALSSNRVPFDRERYRASFQVGVDRGGFNPASAHGLAVSNSPSRTERLKGLRVPMLVIHGDEDPILPLAHGEATAEAVPDAKLVVLRGVGHEIPEPIVDEFLQPILAHLHAHD